MAAHIQILSANDTFHVPHQGPEAGPVALGGTLIARLLIDAYSKGIFPWFSNDNMPIYWWSPSPRAILYPDCFHASKSLKKWLRQHQCTITVDQDFVEVITRCAEPRQGCEVTWITPKIDQAYRMLHDQGFAHSVEVWYEDQLIGGIYGVGLGKHFYGESMFSNRTNGSKIAMLALCQILHREDFTFLDCQLMTRHLTSLGAIALPRPEFLRYIEENKKLQHQPTIWNQSEIWRSYNSPWDLNL